MQRYYNCPTEIHLLISTLDLDIYRAQDGAGGLVGKANSDYCGAISNCAAYGTIRTAYKSGTYVNPSNSQPFTNIFIGGIVSNSVANAQTKIENCIWAGTLQDETNLGAEAHISAIGTLNGMAENGVQNCYALKGIPYVTTHNAHNTGITTITATQLASGEVAYRLGEAWGQNVDGEGEKDAKPVLGGAKVYYGYDTCAEDALPIYTNSVIQAERLAHSYVDGSICIECGHFDTDATEVEIYDGYYSRVIIDDDIEVEKLTYYRTLPNTEWNSLYVPFEIEVTDELLENYEVAYMNNMHTYDVDDDGSIDQMEMEIIKIKNGTLKANYPYFIRAKNTAAMDMSLVIKDAIVESTVGRTVSCQSVRQVFELRGIYERMRQLDFAEMYGTHYAISTEGGWWRTEGLNPFRAYLTIIPRSGTPVNAPAMRSISIRVKGEGTTDIEYSEFTIHNSEIIYDLMGRRVETMTKGGVYIVNGQKVVW